MEWKKYAYTFLITAAIFATAILASTYFSQKKVNEIRDLQEKIAIDILSSETQFSLLEESSCSDLGGASALSQELGTLEDKLSYTEKNRGSNDNNILELKRYYSLLEIKDYILMNKISEKCKKTPLTIIYFYSTPEECPDCEKEGYVLTRLREEYPEVRVYSFDYNLDLSALKTFIAMHKVENRLPAVFIKKNVYHGFQSMEDIEKIMPELQKLKDAKNATSTSTSTPKKR